MVGESRIVRGWLGIALAGAGFLYGVRLLSANPSPTVDSPQRALLKRYCVTCHNEKLRTAGLMLDKADVSNVSQDAEVWEKVVRKLRAEAMPPPGMPRPDKAGYDSLATYLETELDRAAAANPNPGRPAVHRLNRAEYANAIRDLLSIDTEAIDVTSLLPADDSGYGFDNIGAVLSLSPLLLERYMSAARQVSRLALGDPALQPDLRTYQISDRLLQDDRMGEKLPFGSRGGIAIRHFFPLDGEYTIRVELQRSGGATVPKILGLEEPHELELRLDGERIKQFTFGGGSGEGPRPDPNLEIRIPVHAGTHLVAVDFSKESPKPEGILNADRTEERGEPAVDSVAINGPFNATGSGETPSRRRILVCHPTRQEQEEPCARKILLSLAHRAYRRPVTDAELRALLSLYSAARSQGDFETGIQMALRGVLVAPEFLFRIERDPQNVPPGTAYRISDLDLASRLSFFLWSSIPDDPLLNLAAQGKLHEPAVLEQQVRRMLDDPRSQALVDNFYGQWLYLRNMREVSPDRVAAPDFDENLRAAMEQETALFLQSQLREDHSVLDLLNANYTYLNERLARHYGIPGIYGSHFRRVVLKQPERIGLLGKGSILTVTSYANRTSPVLRGKWVLENLLGTPPPPPPPNVPSLQDQGEAGAKLSMREQMERHRTNPICASCHSRMDPIGFALENFDAIGKWRTTSGAANTPIDASGVLPDGTKFMGPAGLRDVLLSKPEQFVTTVTEKFLTYALGRGIEYYDAPAVRKIVRDAAATNYRWSSLITGIVNSNPFQMRRSREP
jgi:mono/diheme cytochrome c family protein